MKYLFLMFLTIPTMASARELSDLYYLPQQGEFVGKSDFYSTSSELRGSFSGVDVSLKTEDKLFKQLLGFGFTDWFTLSIEAPFSFGGDVTYTVSGTPTVTTSLDSESLGAVVNFSFLIIDHEDTGTKLGLDLHYNPKSLNNRDIGYAGGTLRGGGNFSEKTSWLIASSYLQYEKTDEVKSFSAQTTKVSIQHKFNDSFFIRPSALLVIESKTDRIDESFEIHYKPRFGGDLSLGGNLGSQNVLGMLSIQYSRGAAEYFESGAIIPANITGLLFNGSVAYIF